MTILSYMSSGNLSFAVITARLQKDGQMNLPTIGFITSGTRNDSPENCGNLSLARGISLGTFISSTTTMPGGRTFPRRPIFGCVG